MLRNDCRDWFRKKAGQCQLRRQDKPTKIANVQKSRLRFHDIFKARERSCSMSNLAVFEKCGPSAEGKIMSHVISWLTPMLRQTHLPGLVNIQKAIEHGPVEIGDLPS